MFRRTLALAALLMLTAGWTAPKGPPWVSIEYPPSPYDQSTRGAFLLVHAFHHGTPANFPVSATAEGMVNGKRVTQPLSLARTSRTGVYALRRQWAEDGIYTLVIRVSQGPDDAATALVELGADGRVAAVQVPTERRGGWEVPMQVSAQDVDVALRARVARLAAR